MAIHSSTLALKISWMEESDRLVHGVAKESDTTERLDFLSFFLSFFLYHNFKYRFDLT